MIDLGQRFRGLDRIPAPDLRSDILRRQPSPPPSGSGRRRVGATLVAVLLAAAGVVVVGRVFFGAVGDHVVGRGTSVASPMERAGTVAIVALTRAGLHDYGGTYFDYGGIRPQEDGWIAAFCSPSSARGGCNLASADAFLTLVPDGEDLVVAEVNGAFTEDQRAQLMGYREPAAPPAARWIYRPIVLGAIDETDAPAFIASSYWTGAIPSNLGSLCRFEVVDSQGEIVYPTKGSPVHPPESEPDRDGWMVAEIPESVRSPEGRMLCGDWLPLQAVPEGPRHVLTSGTFATGENRGEDWRLVVWRGENVDDPDVLEEWRLKAEGEDVLCWGFDAAHQSSEMFGQRIPPGGCSPLTKAGIREPFGIRMSGPLGGEGSEKMAVGDVSAEVASLEFRLADGDVLRAGLLDPPANLDIPRRFYVLTLPPGARGEIAALDEKGRILGTEPLGGDGSG
jgi:hypothetical protein